MVKEIHMKKSAMIVESSKLLGSAGAKAQNNKKSWNYTIFSKIKERQRFIKILMIASIIST